MKPLIYLSLFFISLSFSSLALAHQCEADRWGPADSEYFRTCYSGNPSAETAEKWFVSQSKKKILDKWQGLYAVRIQKQIDASCRANIKLDNGSSGTCCSAYVGYRLKH